jgi:hypothetical protein
MEKRERGVSNKLLVTAVILLLVMAGVLLWLLFTLLPNSDRVPTGHVDEFDIRIGVICRNEDGSSCYDDEDDFIPEVTPGGRQPNYYEEKKINGKTETETDIEREGIVYVDDKNGRYVYQKSLNIFENAAFEYTNKIAPGVSNSYNFKVHNETENTIRYDIEFVEDSEYAINMLYRLRRGNEYVAGSDSEWLSASELATVLKELPMDGVDSYTLDWEWPYESGRDALDTEIGEKMVSEYSLEIKINFEEV